VLLPCGHTAVHIPWVELIVALQIAPAACAEIRIKVLTEPEGIGTRDIAACSVTITGIPEHRFLTAISPVIVAVITHIAVYLAGSVDTYASREGLVTDISTCSAIIGIGHQVHTPVVASCLTRSAQV
jgi:hypothetical protein